jgi:hypothetical protein
MRIHHRFSPGSQVACIVSWHCPCSFENLCAEGAWECGSEAASPEYPPRMAPASLPHFKARHAFSCHAYPGTASAKAERFATVIEPP